MKSEYYLAPLHCPGCTEQHIDRGKWAVKKHHKHLCEFCGMIWRVSPYVFGVSLDGKKTFKKDTP